LIIGRLPFLNESPTSNLQTDTGIKGGDGERSLIWKEFFLKEGGEYEGVQSIS
jgi:hypothetical protein